MIKLPYLLYLLLVNSDYNFCTGLGNTLSFTKFFLVCQGKGSVSLLLNSLILLSLVKCLCGCPKMDFLGVLTRKDTLFTNGIFTAW